MSLKIQNWESNPETSLPGEDNLGREKLDAHAGVLRTREATGYETNKSGLAEPESKENFKEQNQNISEPEQQPGSQRPIRIKKRKIFVQVNKAQTKIVTLGLVLQYAKNENGQIRIGFTTTKRLGHAVVRNRIRRRLREVVRLTPETGTFAGYDLVIVGRTATATREFSKLKGDFTYALRQIRKGATTESVGEGDKKTEEAECCDACV